MEHEDRIHNKGKNNDNINNSDKIFFPFKKCLNFWGFYLL